MKYRAIVTFPRKTVTRTGSSSWQVTAKIVKELVEFQERPLHEYAQKRIYDIVKLSEKEWSTLTVRTSKAFISIEVDTHT